MTSKQLSPLRRKDQATGYDRAVKEIVAWLRSHDFMALNDAADLIEAGEYLK